MNQKLQLMLPFLMLIAAAHAGGTQIPGEITGLCLGGQLDSPIRLEVYSDFQCPSCRNFYIETIRPVLKNYCSADKVCVVYHEFPLATHQYAREAARYAQAAQRLGRKQYFAVVDTLYEQQAIWSQNGSLEATVAKAISAEDLPKLKKLMRDPSVNEAIDLSIAVGQKREVKSTPTFFVTAIGREQRVVGGLPYPVLKDFFDKIVK